MELYGSTTAVEICGAGVDGELQLGLLAIVDAQSFHQQGGESGSGATTEAVEDEEALETGALIGQLSDAVEYQVDDFLSNGVVTTGVVVGGIFLSSDQLFRVEELAVGSSSDLIWNDNFIHWNNNLKHFI